MSIIVIIFTISCIFFSYMDIQTGFISRYLLWAVTFSILCAEFFRGKLPGFFISLTGCLLGLILFYLARILSGKKLGLADVWFSGFIGAALGPVWWYVAMALACVSGLLFGICSKKKKFPFIPFLSTGAIVALCISMIKAA